MNIFVYMVNHLVELHVMYSNNKFDPKIEFLDHFCINKDIISKLRLHKYINIYIYPVLTATLLNSGII